MAIRQSVAMTKQLGKISGTYEGGGAEAHMYDAQKTCKSTKWRDKTPEESQTLAMILKMNSIFSGMPSSMLNSILRCRSLELWRCGPSEVFSNLDRQSSDLCFFKAKAEERSFLLMGTVDRMADDSGVHYLAKTTCWFAKVPKSEYFISDFKLGSAIHIKAFAHKMKKQTQEVARFLRMKEVFDTPVGQRTAEQRALLLNELGKSVFFSNLDPGLFRRLIERIQCTLYHRGDVIFRQGDAVDHMYRFIQVGRVRGEVRSDDEQYLDAPIDDRPVVHQFGIRDGGCFGQLIDFHNASEEEKNDDSGQYADLKASRKASQVAGVEPGVLATGDRGKRASLFAMLSRTASITVDSGTCGIIEVPAIEFDRSMHGGKVMVDVDFVMLLLSKPRAHLTQVESGQLLFNMRNNKYFADLNDAQMEKVVQMPSLTCRRHRYRSAIFHQGDSCAEPHVMHVLAKGAVCMRMALSGEVVRELEVTEGEAFGLGGSAQSSRRFFSATVETREETCVYEFSNTDFEAVLAESKAVGGGSSGRSMRQLQVARIAEGLLGMSHFRLDAVDSLQRVAAFFELVVFDGGEVIWSDYEHSPVSEPYHYYIVEGEVLVEVVTTRGSSAGPRPSGGANSKRDREIAKMREEGKQVSREGSGWTMAEGKRAGRAAARAEAGKIRNKIGITLIRQHFGCLCICRHIPSSSKAKGGRRRVRTAGAHGLADSSAVSTIDSTVGSPIDGDVQREWRFVCASKKVKCLRIHKSELTALPNTSSVSALQRDSREQFLRWKERYEKETKGVNGYEKETKGESSEESNSTHGAHGGTAGSGYGNQSKTTASPPSKPVVDFPARQREPIKIAALDEPEPPPPQLLSRNQAHLSVSLIDLQQVIVPKTARQSAEWPFAQVPPPKKNPLSPKAAMVYAPSRLQAQYSLLFPRQEKIGPTSVPVDTKMGWSDGCSSPAGVCESRDGWKEGLQLTRADMRMEMSADLNADSRDGCAVDVRRRSHTKTWTRESGPLPISLHSRPTSSTVNGWTAEATVGSPHNGLVDSMQGSFVYAKRMVRVKKPRMNRTKTAGSTKADTAAAAAAAAARMAGKIVTKPRDAGKHRKRGLSAWDE
jgi:CRP-like cAMP-binding protein